MNIYPTLVCSALMIGLSGCAPHQPASTTPQTSKATPTLEMLVPEAVAAMKGFGGSLKGELEAAMKDGGPQNALEVCNTKANGIAEKHSQETGFQLGRVAVKNRNPNQQAAGWTREVMDQFEARKSAGEAVDKLMYKAIVDAPNGKEFRLMKAIPTGGVCIVCHGENIDPALHAKIKSLYPMDTATGFKPGDIRGAFVVSKPL